MSNAYLLKCSISNVTQCTIVLPGRENMDISVTLHMPPFIPARIPNCTHSPRLSLCPLCIPDTLAMDHRQVVGTVNGDSVLSTLARILVSASESCFLAYVLRRCQLVSVRRICSGLDSPPLGQGMLLPLGCLAASPAVLGGVAQCLSSGLACPL